MSDWRSVEAHDQLVEQACLIFRGSRVVEQEIDSEPRFNAFYASARAAVERLPEAQQLQAMFDYLSDIIVRLSEKGDEEGILFATAAWKRLERHEKAQSGI